MSNRLYRASRMAPPVAAPVQPAPLIGRAVFGVHLGIRFKVETLQRDGLFQGRFVLMDAGRSRDNGGVDNYQVTDNAWATQAEALAYATEAAHHAIQAIPPFTAGAPSR